MKYWKVECSNGLCGCDDNFVTTTADNYKFTEGDLLEMYVYESGYAGIENDEWEEKGESDDAYENYQVAILENSCWDEITKEEYDYLLNEEGWEER